MTQETTNTGKALERRVTDAYRAIGARRMAHDVEIAGHQIDVYVEMETADRMPPQSLVEPRDVEADQLNEQLLDLGFYPKGGKQEPTIDLRVHNDREFLEALF